MGVLRRTPADEPEIEPDEEVVMQKDRVEVMQTLRTAAAYGERGEFTQAQSLLSAHEGRLNSRSAQTPVSATLSLELQDARQRMQSRSAWEQGGFAQQQQQMQMHSMQRSMNMAQQGSAMSPQMYCTPQQQ